MAHDMMSSLLTVIFHRYTPQFNGNNQAVQISKQHALSQYGSDKQAVWIAKYSHTSVVDLGQIANKMRNDQWGFLVAP